MRPKDFLTCALFIVGAECAGLIGALFTTPAIPAWYENLSKPVLNPPAAVFGPVWTTLYALMGIAAVLVWRKRKSSSNAILKQAAKILRKEPNEHDINIALGFFAGQLVLNTLWSIIFFGMKNLGGALIEISVLWLAIIATIFFFWKVSKTAAWLLVPYILWVTFAGYLNYMIWALN